MKKIRRKRNTVVSPKIIAIVFIGLLFTTIAFAQTTYNLYANGHLELDLQDGVIITDVKLESMSENSSYKVNHYVETLLTNEIILADKDSEVSLNVEIKNTDNVKYRFDGIIYDTTGNEELGTYTNTDIVPEVITDDTSTGIGDLIEEKSSKNIIVKYKYNNETFTDGNLTGTIKFKFTRLYNITYELNGGVQAENQPTYYAEGETVEILDASKTNATFVGWYEDSTFSGNKVTNLNNKTGDITLYAKYNQNYNIYFQMPPDWYKDDSESDYTVKMYLYNKTSETAYMVWPGIDMTKIDERNIYKYTINESYLENYTDIIFTNGKESSITWLNDDIKRKQTIDLEFTSNDWGKIFVPKIYPNRANSNEVRFFTIDKHNLKYYLWNNATGNNNGSWPGSSITESAGGSAVQFKFNRNQFDKMILNRGQDQEQTSDMDVPQYCDLTFYTSNYNSSNYYFYATRTYYDGEWISFDEWNSTQYSEWKNNGDYIAFQETNNIINNINANIN